MKNDFQFWIIIKIPNFGIIDKMAYNELIDIIKDIGKYDNIIKTAETDAKTIIEKAETDAKTIIEKAETDAKTILEKAMIKKNEEEADIKKEKEKASLILASAIQQENYILRNIGKVKTLHDAKMKLKKEKEDLSNVIDEMKNTKEILTNTINDLQKKLKNLTDDEVGGIITLNVGDRLFTTLKSTLQKKNTFLKAIVSDKHTTIKDKNGYIFIDRDPDLFDSVLFYLRTNCLKDKDYLISELDYYGFDQKEIDDLYDNYEISE